MGGETRNRRGLANKLIPYCLEIIDEYGPVTADVMAQVLRAEYSIDLTTTELPGMITHYGEGRIGKTKIRLNFPPFGRRLVNVYHRPGQSIENPPLPRKPIHPITDVFDD